MTSWEGELPKGWAWSTIGEICRVVQGQSPPGTSYNTEGVGTPFLQGKAEFGSLTPNFRKWTTEPKKFAEPGAVLLSIRAPVGPTNVAPTKCAVGRGLAALHPEGGILSEYVLWAMRSTEQALADRATGSTFSAVSGNQVRTHAVRVPPLAEQERIVAAIEEHLSRLDAAVATIASAGRRLEAFERAAVSSLFERDDWAWTTLGEIADLKGGVTKDAKRQADPSFVEVPYLRVANVQRGFLDLSEVTNIRVAPAKAAQLALQPGDILFNEGGDRDKLGRGAVWDGEIEGCIHQNHVFRARMTSSDFDPAFVSMHGNTWGQKWFEQHGKQTTNLASINLRTLKSFPVPAPALDEQTAVMAELDSLLASETHLTAKVGRAQAHAAALRGSILAAAFSGHLVPQDPSDASADELLARIAAERSPAETRRRRVRS